MRRVWRLTVGDERGAIFLASLVLVTVLTILGLALFDLSRIEGALTIGDAINSQVLYCAEAGLGRSMLDYYAGGPTTGQVNGVLGTTNQVTLTFSPAVTTSLPGAPSCSYTVTFKGLTTCSPSATCGLLQATATANGITRNVRIQLLNLSFRTWSTPSQVCTDGSTTCGTPSNPYFSSHTSLDGSNENTGFYITNTGGFPAALSNQPVNGTAGLPGPGTALPYWGQSNGTADPNFMFTGKGGTVTFMWGKSAFVAANPLGAGEQYDTFGWFDTNSTGTSIGTLHPLFTANLSIQPGNTATFTATGNYGFYLSNARGTFMTLRSLGTDTWPNGSGNTITPAPANCGRTSASDPPCPSLPLQHFTVLRQNGGTYWIVAEDLYNFGPGIKCPDTTNFPTSCINRSNIDQDYQDIIFKFSVPFGDPVVSAGSGVTVDPRYWKDWQECPPCS